MTKVEITSHLWRLIPSTFIPSCGQMAYDERLFRDFEGSQPPILRFFHFSNRTLTLGRLEARRIPLDQLLFPYEIRPTGGRAVLHGEEDLCYSILASQRDPLVGGDLIASYEKISALMAQGLRTLGREIHITREKHAGGGDRHCFSAPSQAELTFQGKKVAGGAQARRGDIFLQQGAILLSISEGWERAFPGAGHNMTGLNDDLSLSPLTRDDIQGALSRSFQSAGARLEKTLTIDPFSLKLCAEPTFGKAVHEVL